MPVHKLVNWLMTRENIHIRVANFKKYCKFIHMVITNATCNINIPQDASVATNTVTL